MNCNCICRLRYLEYNTSTRDTSHAKQAGLKECLGKGAIRVLARNKALQPSGCWTNWWSNTHHRIYWTHLKLEPFQHLASNLSWLKQLTIILYHPHAAFACIFFTLLFFGVLDSVLRWCHRRRLPMPTKTRGCHWWHPNRCTGKCIWLHNWRLGPQARWFKTSHQDRVFGRQSSIFHQPTNPLNSQGLLFFWVISHQQNLT